MNRSRFFILALSCVSCIAAISVRLFSVLIEPMRQLWPEAFPTASPTPREFAPIVNVERSHASTRRVRIYAERRAARTHLDPRLVPSLHYAV